MTLRSIELLNTISPKDLEMDLNYYCHIHYYLFQDLYSWAGELRKISISKGGTQFYDPKNIEKYGMLKFEHLRRNNYFLDLDFNEYAESIAEFYNGLNILHPFREGNGRAERVLLTQLVDKKGYALEFDKCDMDFLCDATIAGANGVQDFLNDFFKSNIQTKPRELVL